MARIRALVTPAILKWARETAGYEIVEIAHKLRMPPERILSWERGDARPTLRQAEKLANVYKRPLASFYLPSPPPTIKPPPDYRSPSTAQIGLTPQMRYELRRARYRRRVALELSQELGEEPTPFGLSATLSEPPDRLGHRLRSALGMSVAKQRKWRDPRQAFQAWTAALEDLGVLVFQTTGGRYGVSPEEMRGAAIHETVLPVILIVGRDAWAAKVFTLMHELTHLCLETSSICDWAEDRQIEIFCNMVAGATLVPTSDLLIRYSSVTSGNREPTDQEIETLEHEYSVSREVIVRRLQILNRVSVQFYSQKRAQYQREFERRKAEKTGGGGFLSWRQMILRSNGRRYSALVLDAYYQGSITLTNVSRHLDMNLRYFDWFEEQILAGR